MDFKRKFQMQEAANTRIFWKKIDTFTAIIEDQNFLLSTK